MPFSRLLFNKSNKLNTNMGTLNYQTNYMRKKIQNLPVTYSKMTNMDKLLMQMELAAMLGFFSDLDPREFGADYDRIIEDDKNDI